jgi:hypothetical protein
VTAVVVRDGRLLRGADPAEVWALVADPARIEDWAPVHSAGYLGTELPAVGHTVFVRVNRLGDPKNALRFRIAEWDAGHRYRCEIDGVRLGSEHRLDVIVTAEVDEGAPAADLELRYFADVPPAAAPAFRWWVRTRLARAVAGVAGLAASP